MIKTRLRYCVFDPDPNGNERYYVRKPGRAKIRIRANFQDASGNITPEFMKAYFDALATLDGVKVPPKTPREKTFFWLVDQYFRSPEFARYDELTKADKRSVLNRYCETAGDLANVTPRSVVRGRIKGRRENDNWELLSGTFDPAPTLVGGG